MFNGDEARPSVPYGVVRRLAYEERKKQTTPYLRVFCGDQGRHGYTAGGGLGLEVNGALYRFTGGVKRNPNFHDGSGNLTPQGEMALAFGVPGLLAVNCDWHWVQSECTLDLSEYQIAYVAQFYSALRQGTIAMPVFQARHWANKYGKQILPGQENCTSLILKLVSLAAGVKIAECKPFEAIPVLKAKFGALMTRIDLLLIDCLAMPEQELAALLSQLGQIHGATDWRELAKGHGTIPEWLNFYILRDLINGEEE